MNRIEFSNFRKYKEFNPLVCDGITFLVGRNNAGKSTLAKALLLIDNYFKSSNFTQLSFGNHILENANIVTYGRAKNVNAETNSISFSLSNDIYDVSLSLTGDDDKSFGDVLFLTMIEYASGIAFTFDMVSKELIVSLKNKSKSNAPQDSLVEDLKSLINETDKQILNSNLKKTSKEYIELVTQKEKHEVKLKEIQELSNETENSRFHLVGEFNDRQSLVENVEYLLTFSEAEYNRIFNNIQKGEESPKEFLDLKAFNDYGYFNIIHGIFTIMLEFFRTCSYIYLSANSTKQSALFAIRDKNNALAQAIDDYQQLNILPGEEEQRFVIDWMKAFDVGENFKIQIFGGEAYEMKIVSNEKEIHLADKGMGSIQAMTLIMKLACVIRKYNLNKELMEIQGFKNYATVIIEEPELNLHPGLQSKLADLFLDVFTKYGINFIIETHSEYILRRSQVLVAEKEFEVAPNDNPFCVYYFPLAIDEQPYRLEYREDGAFNKNFGDGFFDEASSSTLELLKLKRQKESLMFTVYSEKEIFENIVVFNEQSPNWYNIFCNHSDVCLNITDEDLENEQVQGTPIFEFIMANGGRSPIALKEFFQTIEEDNSAIIQKPRSAFFLNITKEKAEQLQSDFGILVQSSEAIDDSALKGTFFRELPEGIKVESKSKIGWQTLLDFNHPPSNSLIITDDWLFKNEEDSKIVGENNTINLIDSLLPKKLEIDYHILLITKDQNRSKEKCEQLAGKIIGQIKALRKFEISVEIVFTETIHKRKVFLNYMSITCDKGFSMFKIKDSKTVRSDNDFRYEKAFERNQVNIGDSVYVSDGILMQKIYDKCKSVTEYIKNKCQDPDQRILGDCHHNKSIKNRLLNNI